MDASRFTILMGHQEQEEDMTINLLAIDLGKRSFHIFGVDQDGVFASCNRAKLCQTIEDLNPTTVAMEACASSHLGSALPCRSALRPADQPTLRQGLCQRIEERCDGRGGGLWGGCAPDDALRSGQVG